MTAIKTKPLNHEDRQVGYLVECPNCQTDIRVPVFEMLMAVPLAEWQVPPQNTAIAEGGWYHAWGSESDASTLGLVFPNASRGEPTPGQPHTITCFGCGHAFTVTNGTVEDVG